MDILVAGGTGFVGRHLCRELDDRGHEVTAASRSPGTVDLPVGVERIHLDVTEPDLTDAVAGHDAVVNLVALPSHRELRGRSHDAVHRQGTTNLLAASERTGVDRFVQLSALGVDGDVDTAYFRAKREAEARVRDADLEWVVYRASVVFGEGCAFLPFLRWIVPPVIAPLPGGGAMRIQPIWVGDLVPMLADGLEADRHAGEIYELGGPEQLPFREVVEQVCGSRYVLPIPLPIAGIGFRLAAVLPLVPLGLDQFRVFRKDNVVGENDVRAFGQEPDSLRTLGEYLDSHT